MTPQGREIVLGVGAGIAAYKACDLLRRLQDRGFLVTVVPTANSLRFVGKATWEALSHRPVHTEVWSDVPSVPHVELGRRANLIVIAPATADLIARIAAGRADDLLTSTVLSSRAPVILVPAMHPEMWSNVATVENVRILRLRGMFVMEPAYGRLTGEDMGMGRFPDTTEIIDYIEANTSYQADLLGKHIVITGGGTREPIDPVRFIGNRSSGKQAQVLAESAVERGAKVTLILGASTVPALMNVDTVHIETTEEMGAALDQAAAGCDAIIMTAAVADARPITKEMKKIKKSELGSILLQENPDLLARITANRRPGQVIVGFAAETESDLATLVELGREKLKRKNVDLLFVNDVSEGRVFGSDSTEGFLLNSEGEIHRFVNSSKGDVARSILDAVSERLTNE